MYQGWAPGSFRKPAGNVYGKGNLQVTNVISYLTRARWTHLVTPLGEYFTLLSSTWWTQNGFQSTHREHKKYPEHTVATICWEMTHLLYMVISQSTNWCKSYDTPILVNRESLVLTDRYLIGELYRSILQNTLVPFARHHFGDNNSYQDNNTTHYRARVVFDFLQQGNVTKIEQPAISPHCNPIEHIWNELGRAITRMHNAPQNLGELRRVLLDKWAEILVEHLQRPVASMSRRLVAITAAKGRNTRYWPSIHKTTPTGSIMQKIQVCLTKFTT